MDGNDSQDHVLDGSTDSGGNESQAAANRVDSPQPAHPHGGVEIAAPTPEPEPAPTGESEPSAPSPSGPPVLVLGMHRSGTSAMAGAFCSLGGWAGGVEELLPSNAANPGGYFERGKTNETLDRLLAGVGGSWSNPPCDNLSVYKLESARPDLTALFSELSARLPNDKFLVVKDPRLSLFSSLLRPLMPNATIVVCIRHPLAVARSLMARDGMNLMHGLALWEAYNVALGQGLEGRKVFVWDFKASTLDQLPGFLVQALGHPLQTTHVDLGLRDYIHQNVTEEDEQQWLTVGQLRLWRQLEKLASSQQATYLPHGDLSASSTHILDPGRLVVER